jgi:hypothetical protein
MSDQDHLSSENDGRSRPDGTLPSAQQSSAQQYPGQQYPAQQYPGQRVPDDPVPRERARTEYSGTPPRRSVPAKALIVGTTLALGVVTAGGVAYAATRAASSESADQLPANALDDLLNDQGGSDVGGPPDQGQASAVGPVDALHGTFIVLQDGSYVTTHMQTGAVTAVDSSSISVKSDDGYAKTYVISSDTETADSVTTGTTVTVMATESDGTLTATSIMTGSGDQRGGAPPDRQGNGGSDSNDT